MHDLVTAVTIRLCQNNSLNSTGVSFHSHFRSAVGLIGDCLVKHTLEHWMAFSYPSLSVLLAGGEYSLSTTAIWTSQASISSEGDCHVSMLSRDAMGRERLPHLSICLCVRPKKNLVPQPWTVRL